MHLSMLTREVELPKSVKNQNDTCASRMLHNHLFSLLKNLLFYTYEIENVFTVDDFVMDLSCHLKGSLVMKHPNGGKKKTSPVRQNRV